MLPLPLGLTLSLRGQLATGIAYAECQGEELVELSPPGSAAWPGCSGMSQAWFVKGMLHTHAHTSLAVSLLNPLGSPFPEASCPREFGFGLLTESESLHRILVQ